MLFSDSWRAPEADGEICYRDDLAYATPYVKGVMSDFIDDYIAEGGTNYEVALSKGFDYFDLDSQRRKLRNRRLGF